MTFNTRQSAGGFSLMELMITVTILLILAAVAVPNYRNHVKRANRSDAVAALQRVAAAQEKFYLQHNTYSNSLTETGLNIEDHTQFYELQIESADTAAFAVKARPIGGQARDTDCSVITIDNQGRIVAENGDGHDTTSLCIR